MANTYKLKVDIKLKKTGTVPLFVQYDAARLEFKLYDGGKPFDLTGYGSVEFTHKKPSGKVVVSDGAIEVDEKGDKIIAYDYYGSEMGELGFTLVSFSLFDEDNNKISMQPFKIEVVTDLRDSLVDRANPEVGKLQEFQADLQIVKDDMIAKTEDTLLATEEALTAAANAQANAEQWKYESAYNVATQYRKNNTITFNGEGYIAKKDVKGVSPTGLLNDPNWALIAKKGADGTGTVVRHRDVFTSTANQTVFTLSKTYDQFQNRIDVTVGNVPQSSPANFIEASANTIQFTEPLPAGIQVIASYFSTAQPLKTDLETVVNSHTTTLNSTNNLITQQTTKLNEVTATLADKAEESDLAEVKQQLEVKANQSDMNEVLALKESKADIGYVNSKIGSLGNTKTFKGSTTFSSLPTAGAEVGDYWYVSDRTSNFAWNRTAWTDIGNSFKLGDGTVAPRNILMTDVINNIFTFEVGNIIYTNGANQEKNNRLRSKNPIFVKAGTVIRLVDKSTYSYSVFLYTADSISSFIKTPMGIGWHTTEYKVPMDCFIRVALRFNDERVLSTSSDLNVNSALSIIQSMTTPKEIITEKPLVLTDYFTFEIGSVYPSSGGNNNVTNRIRTTAPTLFKKGTKFSLMNPLSFSYNIILYSSSSLASKVDAPLGSAWYTSDYTLSNDMYVRLAIRHNDDRVLTNVSDLDLESAIKITENLMIKKQNITANSVGKPELTEDLKSELFNNKNLVTYPRYVDIPVPFGIWQDGCIIEDEMWFFMHLGNLPIKRLDKNTYTVKSDLTHTLGHCNSADYFNGRLMTYDPDDEKLYLYKNPYGKTTLSQTDENCLVINMKKIAADGSVVKFDALNGGISFGENEKILYYLAYDKLNTDLPMTVYKILLGMGSNDLSDKTPQMNNLVNFGTFIAGKSETDYNGTFKVLTKFTGDLSGRLYSRPQGMTYNGKIYVAAGFEKLHAYELELNYTTGTYLVNRDLIFDFANSTNMPSKIESEAVFLDGNNLFVGGYNASGGYLGKATV